MLQTRLSGPLCQRFANKYTSCERTSPSLAQRAQKIAKSAYVYDARVDAIGIVSRYNIARVIRSQDVVGLMQAHERLRYVIK